MFKFKLQAVLDKRIHDERLCYKDIARYRHIHHHLNSEIAKIEENIQSAKQQALVGKGDRITGYEIQNLIINQKKYIDLMLDAITVKKQEIEKNKIILVQKHALLIQAHKARKILEILKEKAKKVYFDRLAKAEQAHLEEANLIHYHIHNIKNQKS